MVKSKIDKLIDQAEETNRVIRDLTFALLRVPTKVLPLPPQVRTAIPAAEKTNEFIAEAYFDTIRGIAGGLQSERGQEAIDVLAMQQIQGPAKVALPKPRTQKQRSFQKRQSLAFQAANRAVRKKNGQLRKGKTQRDVAKMAQRILRNGRPKKKPGPKTSRRAGETGRRKRSR